MSEETHAQEILDTEPTHHAEHIVGPRVYGIIFGLLMFFTAITVGASYIDMYAFNAVVALAIAVHQGRAGHPFLHARQVQLAANKAHCRGWLLHLRGAHHHDHDRLHQPRLGAVVEARRRG